MIICLFFLDSMRFSTSHATLILHDTITNRNSSGSTRKKVKNGEQICSVHT